jgi:hypothetical protein
MFARRHFPSDMPSGSVDLSFSNSSRQNIFCSLSVPGQNRFFYDAIILLYLYLRTFQLPIVIASNKHSLGYLCYLFYYLFYALTSNVSFSKTQTFPGGQIFSTRLHAHDWVPKDFRLCSVITITNFAHSVFFSFFLHGHAIL